ERDAERDAGRHRARAPEARPDVAPDDAGEGEGVRPVGAVSRVGTGGLLRNAGAASAGGSPVRPRRGGGPCVAATECPCLGAAAEEGDEARRAQQAEHVAAPVEQLLEVTGEGRCVPVVRAHPPLLPAPGGSGASFGAQAGASPRGPLRQTPATVSPRGAVN